MEPSVSRSHRQDVPRCSRVLDVRNRLVEPAQVVRRQPGDGDPHGLVLEQPANSVRLHEILQTEPGDVVSAARGVDHLPFGLEDLQRLTHRDDARAQLERDLLLPDPVIRPQGTSGDPVPKVGQRRLLGGHGTRGPRQPIRRPQ